MKEGSKVFLHNFDYWYISFRYISAPESMRGHALAGGDFLGVASAGRPLKDSSLTLRVTGESASLQMRADKNLSPDYEIGVFLLKLCGA